ncbi:putative glycosyltransferase EpsD [Lachnospiraceae bacterium]|nr:putative glycosyltransferase EpsD [Lachnospiraceae bacterium]
MKIVIFGAGKFYHENKGKIPSEIEIAAILDNNPKLQGRYIDSHPIVSVDKVGRFFYDKIVLMSASEDEMKCQLINLGVEKDSIWYWERFISEMKHGVFKSYCGSVDSAKVYGKNILILSTDLDYNGGTIAAVYAAKVLQELGNRVILAAPKGDKTFIREVTDSGLDITVCPALPYIGREEIFWIEQFDFVLVNVFQMAPCVYEISKIKPIMWWIHEFSELYEKMLNRYQEYIDKEKMKHINIYTVSSIAKRNFNRYFPNKKTVNLSYGIPDQSTESNFSPQKEELIFAIIGTVCARKAQEIFVKAVELLYLEEKQNVQFWIVGFIGNDEYSNQIRKLASKMEEVKIVGSLTRSEIFEVYKAIDVVVCPSLEDPLPIVATEGMMYGRTCIVSDATGTSQYIRSGENGLICKAGDITDLCDKMRWVIHNQEKLPIIGREARQIYEEHFSLKQFGKRLEEAVKNTQYDWKR